MRFDINKMFQECDIAHLISIYTYIQGNKPLALLCTGDVIAILTRVFAILMLATLVIFFSLLMKLFYKAKAAKTALQNLVPNKIL